MEYIARILNIKCEFVSFRSFFNKEILCWKSEYCKNMPPPQPVLDVEGRIITTDTEIDNKGERPTIKKVMKQLLGTVGLKYMHKYFMRYNKEYVYAGKKCHYICAIFRNTAV